MSQERSVRYVDATVRDLSSPPWGSAMSTEDLAGVAGGVAESGAAVIEAVDADCARGALELRGESPWDRLRAVVREVGDVPVGIVASGRSLWGRTWLAPDLVRRFVLGAAESGVSRLRVFDPLNNAETLEPAATAAVEAGIRFVPTLILGPSPDPADPRWLQESRALAGLPGASALCISDKAGHFGRPRRISSASPSRTR
jgi:pyruvate carboxylase